MKYQTFLFVLLSIFLSLPLSSQVYNIDPSHTYISSTVQRFGAVNIIGRFQDVSGSITLNRDDNSLTAVEVVIKVDSYNANNSGGEAAVKSVPFWMQAPILK